jgi:RNase P subunit RPR2
MFETNNRDGEPPPSVICPRCQVAMVPIKKKPVLLAGFIEVVYRCRKCATETKRTVKDE